METISIFTLIAIASGVIFGLKKFDDHCQRKFSHKFLSIRAFCLISISAVSIYFGTQCLSLSKANGIALMTIGSLPLLFVAYNNFKHTDSRHGFVGTALQLLTYGILSPLIVAGIVIYSTLATLSLFQPRIRVYIRL